MRRDRTGRRQVPWAKMIAGAVALAVLALVVSVLGRGRHVPDGPVPVVWNQQACAHCRMAVGEPAHAAQLITTGGDVLFFDDPGCLLSYVDEHQGKAGSPSVPSLPSIGRPQRDAGSDLDQKPLRDLRSLGIHRIWFHDRASDRWIGAADVGFVTGATTPMGFGLAATDRTTPGALTLEQARQRVAGAGAAAAAVSDARPVLGQVP